MAALNGVKFGLHIAGLVIPAAKLVSRGAEFPVASKLDCSAVAIRQCCSTAALEKTSRSRQGPDVEVERRKRQPFKWERMKKMVKMGQKAFDFCQLYCTKTI